MAVAGTSSDALLGVRDAFIRFFHDGHDRTVSVAVVPQAVGDSLPIGLPFSDEETLRLAQQRVRELEGRLADTYHFYIATEGGLSSLDIDGTARYFVRNWTVVRSPLGEAWGSSGSVQIPDRIVTGLIKRRSSWRFPARARAAACCAR